MTYSLDIDPTVHTAIDVLSTTALVALANAFDVMKVDPWSGPAVDKERDPDSPVRNMPFGGDGIVSYLILPRDRRVDVLMVTWLG